MPMKERILFSVPTGQLSSEQKAIHPDIHVDTYHGAFLLHRSLQEAMAILTQYELVILDEALYCVGKLNVEPHVLRYKLPCK